ncbi:hypothetical protein GWK48_10590 [Metallosphaera tengchongensis]|uniref:Uncharacterized protein n=1 Tax=Metallosphaera tengchongensis TaxID=1532350 RepID=A0A6N0NVE0_9CREN|nr:hypothetical protein [Metallosphaera tengchongensis]QKR00776.1 hypothetical protein GWK48_10590 [Metallosphaera tengchongensis]
MNLIRKEGKVRIKPPFSIRVGSRRSKARRLSKEIYYKYLVLRNEVYECDTVNALIGSAKCLTTDIEIVTSLEHVVREIVGGEPVECCVQRNKLHGRPDIIMNGVPGEIKTTMRKIDNPPREWLEQACLYCYIYDTHISYLIVAHYTKDKDEGKIIIDKITYFKLI